MPDEKKLPEGRTFMYITPDSAPLRKAPKAQKLTGRQKAQQFRMPPVPNVMKRYNRTSKA
jgi:hypothetical protein